MATKKQPERQRMGQVASILAQSPAVASAFGRWPGFVLMMTGMLVILVLGMLAVVVAGRGALYAFG